MSCNYVNMNGWKKRGDTQKTCHPTNTDNNEPYWFGEGEEEEEENI